VVVAVDAATYAVSVLALSLLTLPTAEPGKPGTAPAGRPTLWADMAEGWADFRSRTWVWATTVQFAFFNLITWAPWMLLGPVEGRAYLGGAAVWGAIMAVQGAGAITAGLRGHAGHPVGPRRPLARPSPSARAAPSARAGPGASAGADAPARGGVNAACGPRRAGRRTRPAARPP
jgi:hypothetical protein